MSDSRAVGADRERASSSPTPRTDPPWASAGSPAHGARLAILTNIVSPVRVPIYQLLSERFDTLLILSGREDNRRWEQQRVFGVRSTVAWGMTRKRTVRSGDGRAAEERYLHLNPGYLWELVRFRPEAIITSEMGLRSAIAVLYGRVARVPVWLWWEGTIHSASIRDRSLLKRALRRFFFAKLVRRWIAFGAAATVHLTSIGIPRDDILHLQSPVDERLYLGLVEPYPLPPDLPRPRVLFVGRLVERKGIYPLLRATRVLQDEGYDFALVVVGDGPEAGRFAAEHLGIRHLHWVRHLPPERMPTIYRACDLLVFPTLDDVWGLVVNEALLSGLPVVASVYAGCAEELLAPRNVFDPLDEQSFLDAFRRALEGQVAQGPAVRLQTIGEVAAAIAADVADRLDRD